MASTLSNLFAVLSLDSQSFLDDLAKTKKKTDSFMASFANVGGAVAAGIGAAAAGGLFLLGESVKEAVAAEEVAAKLNATLANTGKVTGVTATMVDDLANNFQSLTRFEDDTIKAGGEVLARFDEINKDVFPEALGLSLDLATRLGIDVPAASELLGKALADPGVGLMKLKAAGVVFNDETEKMIDTMMKNGDQAGAMALIMDTVKESVGGAAEAAGNTAAGKWERMRNMFGNILETVGTGLLPAITQLGQTLMEYLNRPEVQMFIAALAQSIADFAMNVVTHIPQVVMWFQNVFTFLQQNEGIVIGIFVALGVAVTAWAVMTAAAAWTAMAPFLPVIAVLLAIAAVVYLLYQAWTTNFGGIQDKMAAVWAVVQPVLQMLWDWLSTNIPIALQALADFWQNVLLPAIMNVWSWMQSVLFPFLSSLADFIGAVLGVAITAMAGIWQNVLQPALEKIWTFIRDNLFPLLERFGGWLSEKFSPIFDGISSAIEKVTGWLGTMAEKIQNIQLPDWMTPGSPTPWELGLLGVGDAMRQLARTEMPAFQSSLEMQASPAAVSGSSTALRSAQSGNNGGGLVVNINVTSDGVTDERDVARKIASAVDVLLRERGLA